MALYQVLYCQPIVAKQTTRKVLRPILISFSQIESNQLPVLCLVCMSFAVIEKERTCLCCDAGRVEELEIAAAVARTRAIMVIMIIAKTFACVIGL